MPLSEHVVADYQTVRLSLKGHPMGFLRSRFATERVQTCQAVTASQTDGSMARCAGVVLVRQRPGSAKGVVFVTLEDETGITNVVVWPQTMERFRKEVMGARLLLVEGKVQRSPEGVVHLVANRLFDRSQDLSLLSGDDVDHLEEPAPAFERIEPRDGPERGRLPAPRHHHPRNVRILPPSRDFH
jgi:error-prone DNA polymerase